MSALTQEMEKYIEHEVQLRLHDEKFLLQNDKFQSLENSISRLDNKIDESVRHLDGKLDESIRHIDNKLSWTLGLLVSSIFLPVVLHLLKLI